MIAENSKCSYCKNEKETIIHLFAECPITKQIWIGLNQKISTDLPGLTPKSAFFGFYENDCMLTNHIHIIFKNRFITIETKGFAILLTSLIRFYKLKKLKKI